MRRFSGMGKMAVLAIGIALTAKSARADYVVTVVDANTGLDTVSLLPGEQVSLDLNLAGTGEGGPDRTQLMFFDVSFSVPGLDYNSYALAPPFVTGDTTLDFSVPFASDLPATIGNSIHFEALAALATDFFNTGTLVNFAIGVPDTFLPRATDILIDFVPDDLGSFDDQGRVVSSRPGNTFVLTVVPEPTTLALLGIGGAVASWRFRRRRAA